MNPAFFPAPRVLIFLASVTLALRVHAHGDLHERILALTAQISLHPTNAELWLQRADLRRQHAEFLEAQTDLAHAAQLRPGWANVALQRARLAFDCGNFPVTVRAASDCLRLDPANADAHVLRARSLVRSGTGILPVSPDPEKNPTEQQTGQKLTGGTPVPLQNLTQAIADYDAVLDATNAAAPLPDLFLERARAHAETKNFSAAVAGLDDAMRRFGATPSFALPAIDYERQRGAFTNALARLGRAEKFFDRESFLALRGEIFLQAGNTGAAEKEFAAALAGLDSFTPERRAAPASAELEIRLREGLKRTTVKTNPPGPP